MKTTIFQRILALALLVMMLVSTACVIGKGVAPFMEDRSEGWKPSFPRSDSIGIAIISQSSLDGRYAGWKTLLTPVDFEPYGETTAEQVPLHAENALRFAFGSAYIDNGSIEGSVEENNIKDSWIYYGKETCVIILKSSGSVLACVDTRLQSQLSLDERSLHYSCDLAQMTAEELAEYEALEGSLKDVFVDTTDCALPLSAEDAFKVTAEMVETNHAFQCSGRLAGTGGKFLVYYCEASDAWFVITETFILALSKTIGEQLLLALYSCYYGEDTSQQE